MFEGTRAKFEEPYVKKDMIVGWPELPERNLGKGNQREKCLEFVKIC